MPESVSLLMLQFLDWIASRPRTYVEAMDAWRSSCPRFTVWEDALLDGLIQIEGDGPVQQLQVTLTLRGRTILEGSHVQNSERATPLPPPPPAPPCESSRR
jgi:hypothetical protein